MKRTLLAGALVLALAGCKPAPEPLLVGAFEGDLPCADCPGMATRLTLVRRDSGWAEGRYLMVQVYRERAAAPLLTTGEWTTLRGDADDPDATVYQLDPDKPEGAQNFLKDGEHQIRALNPMLRPYPAGLPQTLKRKAYDLPDDKAVDCLRGGGIPRTGGVCAR
jgi:copper homeostasis protein (lipoprotein)